MIGDNKKVIVFNGVVWGDVIINYFVNDMCCVDFIFLIDYFDDIDKVMKII